MITLLLIPLSTAFACWLIFKIFITIPFRPHQPIRVAGFNIQGILPAYQNQLANELGSMVSENFFSPSLIREKIIDPRNFDKIMPVIEEYVDDFLRNKLKKEMPVISMFVGDKTINSLKEVFIKKLQHLFPQIMNRMAENFVAELNIKTLVAEKIKAISLTEAEQAFQKKLARQLRLAASFAIGIGLLIGILTALVVYLSLGAI